MPLWKSHPLPNREGELFAAIITDESGKQLIAQVTSFQIAEDIVFKHNAVIPYDHPSAVAVREMQAAQQRRAAELPSSAEDGDQADDSQNSKSAIG